MKIVVAGLWHLGLVTVASLTKTGHTICGYDANAALIEELRQGQLPIFEPGLDALLSKATTVTYSADPACVADADIVWVTYDTPVDDDDIADVGFVIEACKPILSRLADHTLVIISSQLPVGTTAQLQALVSSEKKHITFAVIPENLRLGKAIDVFTNPDRFVVGLSDPSDEKRIRQLLGSFTNQFVWMSIESAEMTKHAINAFLATSVTFINELASLCEAVGADARDVERALKTEERIGPKAYLRPGNAIAGGTLARDVQYLSEISKQAQHPAFLLNAIYQSNHHHKAWVFRKIQKQFKELKGKTFALLGLTYKAGTNTLRRSFGLEVCDWLHAAGCTIKAYDPAITELPASLSHVSLNQQLHAALENADAVVVSSDWPEFKAITVNELLAQIRSPVIFDPVGMMSAVWGDDHRVHYFTVGREKSCN